MLAVQRLRCSCRWPRWICLPRRTRRLTCRHRSRSLQRRAMSTASSSWRKVADLPTRPSSSSRPRLFSTRRSWQAFLFPFAPPWHVRIMGGMVNAVLLAHRRLSWRRRLLLLARRPARHTSALFHCHLPLAKLSYSTSPHPTLYITFTTPHPTQQ